jgi:hypothetical protein
VSSLRSPTGSALFWGGHFSSRLDGNHFEVARVMSEREVADALASPNLLAEGLGRRAAAANLTAYKPSPAALLLLGDIAALIPQARPVDQGFVPPPRILAALPGGQLYFDSELQLDTDGAPELTGNATHESETSLQYNNRTSINANRVPYFVLPLPTTWPRRFGVGLGDFAAVIFRRSDRVRRVCGFWAEDQPGRRIGRAVPAPGRRAGAPDGSVQDVGMGPGVITIVFPKSGAAADRRSQNAMLAALASRGPSLFQALGGVMPVA